MWKLAVLPGGEALEVEKQAPFPRKGEDVGEPDRPSAFFVSPSLL